MSGEGARELWTLDCETDPFQFGRDPEPFIWGAFNGRDFYIFKKAGEVVNFFRHRRAAVYAHNGGRFDYRYFEPYFGRGSVSVVQHRIARFSIGRAVYLDSFLILPVPLKSYKKDDIDYAIMERDRRAAAMPEIIRYLRADCVYLYELVHAFRARFGATLTLATAGVRFLGDKLGLKIEKSTKFLDDMFRPWYFGGRVQARRIGVFEGDFSHWDIVSAYPYAMTHRHAWGQTYGPASPPWRGSDFLVVECPSYGFYPLRDEEGRLQYPDDGETREYHVTGWEYLAAQSVLPHPARVRGYRFDRLMDFKEYVHHFFSEKKRAAKDSPERLFAKLFLNSLYGKISANPSRYKDHYFFLKDEKPASPWEFVRELPGVNLYSRPIPESQHRYYHVACGASIAGFVRAMLIPVLTACDVYYCDTDGVIVRGRFPFSSGDDLGQWAKKWEARKIAIAGRKLYAAKTSTGWECASKGARLEAREIVEIARGRAKVWRKSAPSWGIRTGTRWIERSIRSTG